MTAGIFRVYHPYTIMAAVNISLTVRWIGAAVLALTFAVERGGTPANAGDATRAAPRKPARDRSAGTELEGCARPTERVRDGGLLADDYIAITPNGTLQSKDQTLANLRAGATQIKSIEFSDRKVRFYGQTALVTSRAEVNGTNGEANFSGSYRYTRVYVRNEQGKWKIVSFEASRIRDAGRTQVTHVPLWDTNYSGNQALPCPARFLQVNSSPSRQTTPKQLSSERMRVIAPHAERIGPRRGAAPASVSMRRVPIDHASGHPRRLSHSIGCSDPMSRGRMVAARGSIG